MKKLLLLFIRTYQLCISPALGCNCRFTPSCSEYATDAVAHHGIAKGSYLSVRRLLRCHPFSTPHFDPVPK